MKKKLLCTFLGLATLSTPFLGVTSCSSGEQETPLEKKYNDYCEKYQSNFIKAMKETEKPKNYYTCEDLKCECPAHAVVLSTYGPGWVEWGTQFHEGRTDEEVRAMPTRKVAIGLPNCLAPKDQSKMISRDNLIFHMEDFDYLDDAVKTSTVGKPVTVYHGYETNEFEMVAKINEALQIATPYSFLHEDKEEFRKRDLQPLIGKTITDLSWCATTFEESFARKWANEGSETWDVNVPVYKLNFPEDIHCIYVSYSRQKYFDGIYLAWSHEYQLLTERKLNFKVKDVRQEIRYNTQGEDIGNYLLIECDVTRPEE